MYRLNVLLRRYPILDSNTIEAREVFNIIRY
jgi:hypothetical protein